MRRNPTWILALLVIAAMAAGGWYALRPRETLTILSLFQRKYEFQKVSALIDDGILLAMEEVGHRAGRFRLVVAKRDIWPEMDVFRGPGEAIVEAEENPRVVAVLGPSRYHAETMVSSMNLLGVLVVSPDDADPELTKSGFSSDNYMPESNRPNGELNFFRTIPSEDVVERGCAEWAWKHGVRSVFVLGEGNPIRKDEFVRTAARLGIVCTGDHEKADGYEEARDRRMAIPSTNPDAIYLRDSLDDWGEFLAELRCLGWNGTILTKGEHAEGELPEGLVAISRAAPPAGFTRKFTARFGHPPGTEGWYGYLAARAVIDSIDAANTLDRQEIRRACVRLPVFDGSGDSLSNALDVSICREGRPILQETFTLSPPPPSPPKPRLTLSFEGTLHEQWRALAYQMRGTYYIDPLKVNGDDCLTDADLADLRVYRHEIVTGRAPAGVVRPGKSLEELKKIVDQALAEKKHVELLFHRIGGDPGPDQISSDDFEELCKYVHAQGFMVIPAGEARR
jgi:ABC-type branched-subunit amino acid transport system substrate-binding protein